MLNNELRQSIKDIGYRPTGRKFSIPESNLRRWTKQENGTLLPPVLKQSKIIKGTLKVLTLDIENAPLLSYHWGLWKQNIGRPMRKEGNRSYMMSIAMKWLHEDGVHYYETRDEDDSELLANIMPYLDEADIIVGHNAKRFDMKKINAYALLNGMQVPSPYRVIDTMLIAKKHFAFEQNTLEYLTGALCSQKKSSHSKFKGFELWSECMKGNEEAWAEMKHYNIQDVITTEELYLALRSWDKSHPAMTIKMKQDRPRCSTCGSSKIHPDGYSITNVSKFQRYKCNNCGAYSRARSSDIDKEERANILSPVVNG